jgi:hypothetical protein
VLVSSVAVACCNASAEMAARMAGSTVCPY